MDLEKETYTQEEVRELLQEFNVAVEDLKGRIEEKENAIADLEVQMADYGDLKQDNLVTSIKMELAKTGLSEDYFDLVVSEDLEQSVDKINKLVEINKASMVVNSFRPEEHRSSSEYEQAEKKGNTQDMVKSKLSKLFG